MRLFFFLALAALSCLAALPAGATEKPQRLDLCASCHGENGHASAPDIPNLACQNLDYLRNAIAQYRSGQRNVAAMRAAHGMLNAHEIDAILAWYAQQRLVPSAS